MLTFISIILAVIVSPGIILLGIVWLKLWAFIWNECGTLKEWIEGRT